MSRYVHIGELVEKLGLSATTWRRLADRKRVRCVRLNGQRVFDLESCEQLLSGATDETQPNVLAIAREHHRAFCQKKQPPSRSVR